MNANELADDLEYACTVAEPRIEMMKRMKLCATMLRQQQAEIEALNQRVERMIENQSHHEGIAHAGGFESGYQAAKAKTLTDEEILKMAADKFHYSEYRLVIDFARAILRKAQEK